MNIISFFAPVGWVLGLIMFYINKVTSNYGLTLLLFSILVKVLMIPLGIQQQKGMICSARLQPKMKALQKAYGNNKQKYSEELQKLYNEEGFSPMSSCLPLLIQFPILFGMLDVIYSPIKHIVRLPKETISKAIEIATGILGEGGMNAYSQEISVLSAVKANPQPFIDGIGAEATAAITNFDFTFLGLALGEQPTMTPEGKPFGLYLALLLIPVLSGVTSFMMSFITKKYSASNDMSGMNNSMMIMMPIMSIWISFIVPAGVGIYWLISNVLSVIQSIILNKVMNPAEAIEKARLEAEAQAQRERAERIEKKKKAREEKGIKSADEAGLSQKEIARRKLAAARQRDAERYGDEFVDVTDDDVNVK